MSTLIQINSAGAGDMTKAEYDPQNESIVLSAKKEMVSCINKTGALVPKGTIVYLKTSSSSGTQPEIVLASNINEASSSKTIGAIYQDIANDGVGYIVTSGEVDNLNTSAYTAGTRLWLGTTAGSVTTTPPAAPFHAVFIGIVTRSQTTNGRILYNIINGFELEELHNVSIPTTPTNGQKLTYNSTTQVWEAQSDFGKLGIANTDGLYTYYGTFAAAITAATSGQTIELFADITESAVTSITLKNGVNINGNGHTYNYTAATGDCFIDNGVSVTATIQDLIVRRTNHTSGSVWSFTSGSDIDFLGSKTYVTSPSGTGYVANLSSVGTFRNLWILATGTSIAGSFGGNLFNCNIETTGAGNGIVQLFPSATDCRGVSNSGRGFYVYEDGFLNRCVGISSSGYGIYCETSGSNIRLWKCVAVCVSGPGLYVRGTKVYDTLVFSSSSAAIQCSFGSNQIFNTTARSSSAVAINCQVGDLLYSSVFISDGQSSVSGGAKAYNCSIITNWNNATGSAYGTAAAGSEVVNCLLQVTNSGSNCLNATSSVTVKFSNNTFKGATTPVNANVVQNIVNTQDNQGNILL
jgi:hypothetical protein